MSFWSRRRKRSEPSGDSERAPESAPEIHHPETQRYFALEPVKFPVSDYEHLIYSFEDRSSQILPAHLMELLDYCRGLKTLDEHAESCSAAISMSPGAEDESRIDAIKDQLVELVEAGMLKSEDDLTEMCRRVADSSEPPPQIASIGVVTANRVDQLERCLVSFIKNCRSHERTNNFVVVDDSQNPELRTATRQMLKELKNRYEYEIRYAGAEEKRRFIDDLIAEGDLPREIVEFALTNAEGLPFAAGANRNALLLDTAGDMIYSSDDDAICQLAMAPEDDDDEYAASRDMQYWFFPDRETTLQSVSLVDEDFLSLHERFLGKDVSQCLTEFQDIEALNVSRMDRETYRQLQSGGGKVTITFSGLFGDSGEPRPPVLHKLDPRSRERLQAMHLDHLAGLTSREVLRLVPRPRIGRNTGWNTTAIGYDNRELLPPFVPVLRGEDLLFGHILRLCFVDSFVSDLPWAILHAPETRAFSPNVLEESTSAVWPSAVMAACMSSKSFWPGLGNGAERLRGLAQHLMELGSMSLSDFEEHVRTGIWQIIGSHIQQVETQLDESDSSELWAEDLVSYTRNLRTAILDPDYIVPADFRHGRNLDEARRLSQHSIWKFGKLLEIWPQMIETAKRLRAKGRRLTDDVSDARALTMGQASGASHEPSTSSSDSAIVTSERVVNADEVSSASAHHGNLVPRPFIVGAARSGTTLLRMMMHSHPELAITPETHFIPTLFKICQRSSDPRQAFIKRLTSNQHWQQMQIKEELLRERVDKIHPFNFAAALRETYMLYAEKFGKPRWGEKTPPYVLHMSLIQKLLPEAYFIHIIRDGRDVALSVKDVWFGPDTFEKAGGWWLTRITSAREQAASLPHYLEIRYENLVLNPETELKRVCEFIDLSYDPVMLNFTETATILVDSRPLKGHDIHPLITQKLQTSRIGRWKTDMTKSDRRQFEKVAGKMLVELGYEV